MNYPSPVIEMEKPGASGPCPIKIPQDEAFRMRNVFEDHEYGIPAHFRPSGSVSIVDIGANIGLFALYMRDMFPDGVIHCFEPAPQTIRLLEKNTGHLQGIHIFPLALADYDGTASLNIHPGNGGENSLKTNQCFSGESIQVEVKDAAATFQQLGMTYIDILKIDTEGCEVEILKSLKPYLPYVGIVMAEYHSDEDRHEIDALLRSHLLFDARVHWPQLGVVKYINSRLLT